MDIENLPFCIALRKSIYTWARRQARAESQRTGQRVGTGRFVKELADQLHITRRQLFRYMEGATVPPERALVTIARVTGSALPIEYICYRLGIETIRPIPPGSVTRRDLLLPGRSGRTGQQILEGLSGHGGSGPLVQSICRPHDVVRRHAGCSNGHPGRPGGPQAPGAGRRFLNG